MALGGCAKQARSAATTQPGQRAAIERYVGEVEPIRLAVNKLLEGADPILEAFHDRRIPPGEAARRMGGLEQRFAGYALDIAAVDPPTARLRALNAGYANTYVLEDAYLSALAAGLGDGEFDQPAQHAGSPARRHHPLADRPHGPGPWRRHALAGRPSTSRPGEIAPSPTAADRALLCSRADFRSRRGLSARERLPHVCAEHERAHDDQAITDAERIGQRARGVGITSPATAGSGGRRS